MQNFHGDWILILDFGSQLTQLIARRIREQNVYCEIHPFDTPRSTFRENPPCGVILSGGPKSVYDEDAPRLEQEWLVADPPLLGICYGLQILSHTLKHGSVERASKREFGKATLTIDHNEDLLKDVTNHSTVWMSHGDHIIQPPDEFVAIAHTANTSVAAIRHKDRPIYGVQFHPEVVHTEEGEKILRNYLFEVCKCTPAWSASSFIESEIEQIRAQVGDRKVLCALSGGVDSTVVATLIHRAIGDQLQCVFVDNGLLRKNEFQNVLQLYKEHLHLPVEGIDASEQFLQKLNGVSDPEAKRKIIGNTFIEVFDAYVAGHDDHFDLLAQGTLYPDVIESVSFKGPSSTIKSHHNVGGLPEKMQMSLLEPVRELFKDEVRRVGRELNIPERFIARHPFPGPGLGIRIIGEVSEDKLTLLREADEIFIDSLFEWNLYNDVWQALAVLLPVQSVGVMGDERTYDFTIALRAVTSVDGMTADWARLPYDLLAHVSNRIINEVNGVNRVVYDISSKPPATIEWE